MFSTFLTNSLNELGFNVDSQLFKYLTVSGSLDCNHLICSTRIKINELKQYIPVDEIIVNS